MAAVADLLSLVEANLRTNGRASLETMPRQCVHVRRIFGDQRPAVEIGYLELEEYKNTRLSEGAAPKTINHELSYLRRGFRLARRAGLLKEIPEFDLLPLNNTRTGWVTMDQARAIWRTLPAHYADFVEFAWETGWRRGEIARLEWTDIEEDFVVCRAGNAKTRRQRKFPITQRLRRLLLRRATLRRPGCPWVIHRDGERIDQLHCPFKTAARRAGVPDVTLHDFRRSFARRAIQEGLPAKLVMLLMGHTTLSMFLRYQIFEEQDLAAARVSLEAEGSA